MIVFDRELKPMGIGDILDSALELYKKNFAKITILAVILYVPFSLLLTALTSYIYSDFVDIMEFNSDIAIAETGEAVDFLYGIMAFYFSMLVAGLLGIAYNIFLLPVLDAAITRAVFDDVVGVQPKGIRTLIKYGFSKYPALLVNKLLCQLIIYGVTYGSVFAMYLLMIPLMFFFIFTFAANEPSPVLIVVFLVLLFLMIAAILFLIAWVNVKFAFGVQAIVIENKSGTEALSRSSRLTRKSFWPIAVTYAFAYILFFMLPYIAAAGSYVLAYVNRDLYILASTGAQVLSAVFYPFLATLLTMIFINLKVKKEGFDLELKVDRMLEIRNKALESLNSQI